MAEKHHPDRERPVWAGLRVAAILLLVLVLAYWKITLTNQYTWMDSPDLASQVLPWYQYQVGEIQQGRFPLWDPFAWGGQPLLAQAQPATANPVAWMMMVLPTRHGWMKQSVLHGYFVFIHWIAALFFYWFARSLHLSREAAVLGSLVFTLGGYMGSVDWPQMLTGAMWAPVIYGMLFRALRGERFWASAAASGMALGAAVLSGHHQAPVFLGVGAAFLWVWEILVSGRKDKRLLAAGFVLSFLLAGLVSGVQSLPSLEYSKLAVRWVGMPEPVSHEIPVDYLIHNLYGFPAFGFLGILVPGVYRHLNPFLGFVALLFAAVALRWEWAGREVRWLGVLGAGAALFALAGETPLHGMVYSLVPMAEKARSAAMGMVVFHLAAAGLAAVGLDRVLRSEAAPEAAAGIARFFGRAVGVSAAVVIPVWYAYIVFRNGEVKADARIWTCLFLAALASGLLYAWGRGELSRRALVAGLGVLLVAELGNGFNYSMSHRRDDGRTHYLPRLSGDSDLAAFLQAQPGLYRFDHEMASVPYNIGDWYGLETSGSYLASVTENVYRMPIWGGPARRLMGVKYAWRKEPKPEDGAPVFQPKAGGAVVELAGALPRVRTVHRLRGRGGKTVEHALEETDLEREAFLDGPLPELENCEGEDSTSLLRRVSNRVVIWAEMRCRGMVVLSDTWYPGWEAWVDGKPARIYEVYGALRGVVVEKGDHRIEMRFRPRSVYLGLAMTLAGLLGGLLVIRSKR